MQSIINSRNNQHVKYALHIASSAAFRQSEGVFFAEGRRLCQDLAKSIKPKAVFVSQNCLNSLSHAQNLLEDAFVVSESVALKLANAKTPQGLFCIFESPKTKLEDLNLAKGVLVCEEMQDPANVGAVLRSAAGLGFGGAVLAANCADAFSPKALRASMGAVCHMPVVQTQSLQNAVGFLQNAGLTIYGAALANAVPILNLKPKPPFALLIGNEGKGLSPQALKLANTAVCVPMQNQVESLNAAAAAAVIMYALKNTLIN